MRKRSSHQCWQVGSNNSWCSHNCAGYFYLALECMFHVLTARVWAGVGSGHGEAEWDRRVLLHPRPGVGSGAFRGVRDLSSRHRGGLQSYPEHPGTRQQKILFFHMEYHHNNGNFTPLPEHNKWFSSCCPS